MSLVREGEERVKKTATEKFWSIKMVLARESPRGERKNEPERERAKCPWRGVPGNWGRTQNKDADHRGNNLLNQFRLSPPEDNVLKEFPKPKIKGRLQPIRKNKCSLKKKRVKNPVFLSWESAKRGGHILGKKGTCVADKTAEKKKILAKRVAWGGKRIFPW